VTVAVDARELAGQATGVGRYLAELLARWGASSHARRHDFRLYAHRPIEVPPAFAGKVTVLPGAGGTPWEQWTLPRALARSKPDVLFAPGYTAPLTAPCRIVVTIHDVSFAAHPEWFSRREGMRRRWITAWSARRARIVLTDSTYSRDEIVRHVGVPAGKIRTIPLGVHASTPARDARDREPLVLYVGSLFVRRHVDKLIEAFGRVVAERVPESRLEIVGDNRLYPPSDPAHVLHQFGQDIRQRVRIRSYVDDGTLHDLYKRASVFAFLSEYEGFGLTPLEALAAGVPPVVLDTPVAREVYGPAAEYVHDLSPDVVGQSLSSLLTQPEARRRLVQHADAVLGRYSWDRAAETTLVALEEAARE
jgi:glycosyltransferase involved in cell wall biosynthesis